MTSALKLFKIDNVLAASGPHHDSYYNSRNRKATGTAAFVIDLIVITAQFYTTGWLVITVLPQ